MWYTEHRSFDASRAGLRDLEHTVLPGERNWEKLESSAFSLKVGFDNDLERARMILILDMQKEKESFQVEKCYEV